MAWRLLSTDGEEGEDVALLPAAARAIGVEAGNPLRRSLTAVERGDKPGDICSGLFQDAGDEEDHDAKHRIIGALSRLVETGGCN